MEPNPSPLFDAISSLMKKRAEIAAELYDIDQKLAQIAKLSGVDPMTVSQANQGRVAAPVDLRHEGSMPQAMMRFLREAPQGLTRTQLKALLAADPVHGPTIRRSENTFYNAVLRYIRKGAIIERSGILFHPENVPIGDNGQRLPDNVTLFSTKTAADK